MPIVVSPQPPEETLSASVKVNMTVAEKSALQARSKSLGTSMSALMRQAARQAGLFG